MIMKMDMLRRIGRRLGESVESVLKKKEEEGYTEGREGFNMRLP